MTTTHARRTPIGVRRGDVAPRVVIIAPPWVPVPPPAYGGIEAVVALQAAALAASGFDVALVAAPGSAVSGVTCVSPLATLPDAIGHGPSDWEHAIGADALIADGDVVIDHSGPLATLLTGRRAVPVLHVTHGELDARSRRIYSAVAREASSVSFVAISHAQRRSAAELPFAGVCHNAIDCAGLSVGDGAGGYLAFLGRMASQKGAAEAIALARGARMPIRIAAKCREPDEIAYFERYVAPEIGPDVEWLGEIGPEEKHALLGGAEALLFPIDWEEPFGMVMIEAMACGTPVIATPRGAVPEVVRHGVTGFVAPIAELPDALARRHHLSRDACREHVERHFDPPAFGNRWKRLVESSTEVAAARPLLRRSA